MKTAILLLPKISESVDKEAYTNKCIEKITLDGFVLIHPVNKIITLDFVERAETIIDVIYVFTDFGSSILIGYVATKYPDKIRKEHFTHDELEKMSSNELERIFAFVCRKQKIDPAIAKRKSRKREIVVARNLYFKRAKERTGKSLNKIGSVVGQDHATVLHGIKNVNNIRELSRRYDEIFQTDNAFEQINP